MTESRLSAAVHDRLDGLLDPVDERLAAQYPGNRDEIQPVHTIYVSAADATVDTPRLWGEQAIALLDSHAHVFADLDTENALAAVRVQLGRKPVQDFRIDFEDGYGRRSDEEEDAAATSAGRTLAALSADPAGPNWGGIRFKGLPA
ncbi:aldolase, partial [Rhodococcus erythropolis]|nr:aldolase [Rhodococcus erythropolis]